MLKPDLEEAYYDLAQAQLGMDKNSEALATLEKARQKFAANFILEYFTAMAFSREKAYNEAAAALHGGGGHRAGDQSTLLTEGFYFQLGAAN